MTKIYTNALHIMVIATIASILYSFVVGDGEHPGFIKAAFMFGTILSGGWLSIAMVFTGRMLADSNPRASLLDLNVLTSVVCALAAPAGLLLFLDTSIFVDAAIEGVSSSLAGGIVGIAMAFAKKDTA